jgi:Zn ribbon nucleic-acid-binding protein
MFEAQRLSTERLGSGARQPKLRRQGKIAGITCPTLRKRRTAMRNWGDESVNTVAVVRHCATMTRTQRRADDV